jgi:hypothetical protein
LVLQDTTLVGPDYTVVEVLDTVADVAGDEKGLGNKNFLKQQEEEGVGHNLVLKEVQGMSIALQKW